MSSETGIYTMLTYLVAYSRKFHAYNIYHVFHDNSNPKEMPTTNTSQLLDRFCLFCLFLLCLFYPNGNMIISRMISWKDRPDDLLFPVNRLKNDSLCIICPTTAWTSSIGGKQLVVTKLTDL